jgi:hypothetical protein
LGGFALSDPSSKVDPATATLGCMAEQKLTGQKKKDRTNRNNAAGKKANHRLQQYA